MDIIYFFLNKLRIARKKKSFISRKQMIALLLMHSGSGRTIKNRNEFHTNKVNTDYYYVYSNLNIYQTFTQCFQGPRNHVFLNYRIHLSP